MTNRALYFPYMRVPQSTWFTQVLLYWDEVGSIVPVSLAKHPEKLGPYMTSLLQHELVRQVFPEDHLADIPEFAPAFLSFVEGLGSRLEDRRVALAQGRTNRIHMGKMGALTRELVQIGLADEPRSGMWYHVERDTAADFMAYLAFVLSRRPEIDATPLTDRIAEIERVSVQSGGRGPEIAKVRVELLQSILPVPERDVPAATLRTFKDRHQVHLTSFRRRVERELIDIVALEDQDLRRRRLQLFLSEAEESIASISSSLASQGWRTALGSMGALVGGAAGSPLFGGLLAAVGHAVQGRGWPGGGRDFAYAAEVQQHFGPTKAASPS